MKNFVIQCYKIMKTLFIDTHLFDINIVLVEDGRILKEKHVTNIKQNSIYLLSTLKEVIPNKEFDEIIIVTGPGSFTSVRLGVTIAKTLAYTMNKPIKPISFFDLLNYLSDGNLHVFGVNDNNGYFLAKYKNNILIDEYIYVSKNNMDNYNNFQIEEHIEIDYTKISDISQKITSVNPHSVKPLYIKSIGVEYDPIN